MASVNDVEGTTYLSQSLPFGGYKDASLGPGSAWVWAVWAGL